MSAEPFIVQCQNCKEEFPVTAPFPIVRSLIEPIGEIKVYRITSEEIKHFLIQKAKFFKPASRLELVVTYCEKKNSDPHRGHASLRIAFSDDVIEKKAGAGWFDRMGEGEGNIRFIKDVFAGFIQKYQYDRKSLDDILSDYKKLEALENKLGITEQFIEDVKLYCTPRRITTATKESWIFFSARAEKVIEDMLENPETDSVRGRVDIDGRVFPINKDVVEFIVYVHPNETKSSENPLVRQLLLGKGKKNK